MIEEKMSEENKVENDNDIMNVETRNIEGEEPSVDSDIASKTSNYLYKKVLDMKTINFDELEDYQSKTEIDASIYDSAVLDIKQNRIVEGKVINITDKGISTLFYSIKKLKFLLYLNINI